MSVKRVASAVSVLENEALILRGWQVDALELGLTSAAAKLALEITTRQEAIIRLTQDSKEKV
jgi:hypothetical protein